MKVFLVTAGTVFGLIVIAHIWRAAVEGMTLTHDPWFVFITIVAAGLCLWAFRLLLVSSRRNTPPDQ